MNIKKEEFFVRIQKIDFTNFRNIEKGSIVFPNSMLMYGKEASNRKQ